MGLQCRSDLFCSEMCIEAIICSNVHKKKSARTQRRSKLPQLPNCGELDARTASHIKHAFQSLGGRTNVQARSVGDSTKRNPRALGRSKLP